MEGNIGNIKEFQLVEVGPNRFKIKTVFKDGSETQVTGGYEEPLLYSFVKALEGARRMREILKESEAPIVIV